MHFNNVLWKPQLTPYPVHEFMGENRTEVGLYTIKKVRQHENKGASLLMIFPEPCAPNTAISI